jgi:hypothetical protein
MRARPDIAHEMSRILAERAAELHALRVAVSASAPPPERHADLLARIRGFFGLH